MLSDRELALIHGNVDGELDAAERDALTQLIATNPEAAALAADLTRVHDVFARVPARQPSPAMQAAIVAAIPVIPARPHSLPAAAVAQTPSFPRARSESLLTLALRRMEEVFMSRKMFLIGATTVAIIAVVAGRIFPIPPSGNEVGTIGGAEGGGSEIGGVQKADRYRGRAMTEKDVSISDPAIAVLFQNPEIVTLVKSEAFREAMKSDAFRQLQANEAFRKLNSSDSFQRLMSSEAYARLMQNEAYLRLMSSDAARLSMATEANRAVEARQLDARQVEARQLEARQLERELAKVDAYRELMASDAFRMVLSNEAYQRLMASDAARQVFASDAFRQVLANDAFRALNSSEAFRNVARNAQLSELFLNEAARMR
jgi:hypothetical protein